MNHRIVTTYSGRVQGVGFRYRTAEEAAHYRVTGTVRNMPDGTVELVAEGEEAELERFLQAIRRRMAANIRDDTYHRQPATGEFHDFQIR